MTDAQSLTLIVGGAFWSCLMILTGRLLEQHYRAQHTATTPPTKGVGLSYFKEQP